MYGFQHLKAFNTFEPWGKVHVFASATSAYLRYDTTTVIDLVHAADLYLWGGAGFSSGKVSYLWTQRDEIFKSVNQITKYQNQILQKIAFEGQARPANHPTEQQLPGITTKQLTKEVRPTDAQLFGVFF
eukprot:g19218.t1